MRKMFLSILLIHSSICFSQYLELTVLNKSLKPIPYAYILVNHKAVEITDSLGKAKVQFSFIQINDTISVRYLGACTSNVVFNKNIQKEGSFCFYLDEIEICLNEVTVTYENYVKLFKKSTKSINPPHYECHLNAKLNAKIFQSDKLRYSGSGSIQAFNSRELSRTWAWFNPEFKFVTKSDTSKVWSLLNHHLHQALNHPYLCLWGSGNPKKVDGIYSYLGENDSCKIFRITYPKTWFKGIYYQVMYFVDKGTQYIKSAEIIGYTDTKNKDSTQLLNIKFDYTLFKDKKHRGVTYLPNNIEYTMLTNYNTKISLLISDTNLRLRF